MGGRLAIISIYIDDCLIIAHSDDIDTMKGILSGRFTMKDLGIMTSILGIEIDYNCENGTMQL